MRHDILSGPEAFFILSWLSNFCTPGMLMCNGFIGGAGSPASLGTSVPGAWRGVKTDWN